VASRTHLTRMLAGAGGALVVLAATAGCAKAGHDTTPDHRGFALTGKTLVVSAHDTDVEIRPADVREVEVTRWFSGWSVLGASPKAHWSMKGDTLRLDIDCGPAVAQDCDARHRVLVPRGVAVTVSGGDGRVTASGFATALELRSDNGSVVVRDVSGALTLSSDNGSVRGTGLRSPRVSVTSDNGGIDLGFAAAPTRVDAHSDNGRTSLTVPRNARYNIDVDSDNGSKDVGVADHDTSSHVIKVRSNNGAIRIKPTP
jgi:Putative adhesin